MTFHAICSTTAVGRIRALTDPVDAGVVAWRNPDQPGQIIFRRGGRLFPIGYKVKVFIGADEAGDTTFLTEIGPGAEKATSNTDLTYFLYIRVYITDLAGSIIASAVVQTLPAVGATVTAPTASGALPDLTLTEGVAMAPADLSVDFDDGGGALTFALAPTSGALPAGLSLSSGGILSGTPSETVAGRNIVVRATNSAGYDDSGFGLTAEAPAVVEPAPTTTTDTVALTSWGDDFGETVTLPDGPLPVGMLADGSPFVVGGGSAVNIGSFSTPSAAVARTFYEGASGDLVGQTSGTLVAHGAMLNPGRASSGTTLAEMQPVNAGYNESVGGTQGYDEVVLKSNYANYTSSKNVDPGIAGLPIAVAEGTIVKAISHLDPQPVIGSSVVKYLLPLTVLPEVPPEGAFRPAFADPDKTIRWTTADLRMDLLPNRPAGTIAIPPASEYVEKLSVVYTHQHTYNVNSGNIWSTNERGGIDNYYGSSAQEFADAMVGLTYDAWSAADKLAVVTRLVQMGIDIGGRVAQGGIFYPNGGHSHGRLGLLAFAAEMLDSDYLRGLCATVVEYVGYKSTGSGDPVFAELVQTYYVSQADIDASAGVIWGGADVEFTPDQLGWPGFEPEAQLDQHLNALGNSATNPYGYMHVVSSGMLPQILAVRLIPQMLPYYPAPSLLDWIDRFGEWRVKGDADYVRLTSATNTGDGSNPITPWVKDAWAEARDAADIWHPTEALDFRDVYTATDAAGLGVVCFNRAPIITQAGVTVSGTTITIDPAQVTTIPAGIIQDSAGNTFDLAITISPAGEVSVGEPAPTERVIHGILAQSEADQMFRPDSVYRQQPAPALLDETNLRLYMQTDAFIGDTATGAYAVDVTEAEISAGNINPAAAALSNFLAVNAPGWKFGTGDFFVSGTGFDALVEEQEAAAERSIEDLRAVRDLIEGEGLKIRNLIWYWYNSPAASIKNFGRDFSPGLLGQYMDGTTFPLGTEHTTHTRSPVVDYAMLDLDAADGVRGRGEFTVGDTKLSIVSPMPFSSDLYSILADGQEMLNFTDHPDGTYTGRVAQLDRPAWDAVVSFTEQTNTQRVLGSVTENGHMIDFGGPTGQTHPDVSSVLGTIQGAYILGTAILKAEGIRALEQPRILGARRDAADPKVVRVDVSLPNGGDLSYPAEILGDPDPVDIPHHHEVMGFELVRSGIRRPIWNVAAGRDAAYTATITVENAGTGTGASRKGVIKMAFTQDAEIGSFLEFLRGGRTAVIEKDRDHAEALMRWFPTEYLADMDPGGDHPWFGMAVASQPAPIEIVEDTGTAPDPTATDWTLTDNGDGTFTVNQVGDSLTSPTVTDNGDGTFTFEE